MGEFKKEEIIIIKTSLKHDHDIYFEYEVSQSLFQDFILPRLLLYRLECGEQNENKS